MNKLSCILFLILCFCFSSIASNNEEKIKSLIESFSTASDYNEMQGISIDIVYSYKLQALPFLLEGIKNENQKIKIGSYMTLDELIYKEIREPLGMAGIPFKELKLNLVSEEIRPILKEIYEIAIKDATQSPNPDVRAESLYLLALYANEEVVKILKQALKDPSPKVRFEVVYRLRLLGHKEYSYFEAVKGKEPQTPEEYAEFLSDTKWGLYNLAAGKLKKFGKEAIPVLLKLVKEGKEPGRSRALRLLGEMKAEEVIPVFINYLKKDTVDKETEHLQYVSISGLFEMDTEKSIKIIEEYGLKHKNPGIRYYTAERMYRIINPGFEGEKGRYPLIEKEKERLKEEAKRVLIDLAKEVDVYKKLNIGILFINNKEKEGIDIMIDLLKERGGFRSAKMWLESVTKQNFGDIPPVVSKKMLEQYINKWKNWWEKNRDTFEFPD